MDEILQHGTTGMDLEKSNLLENPKYKKVKTENFNQTGKSIPKRKSFAACTTGDF